MARTGHIQHSVGLDGHTHDVPDPGDEVTVTVTFAGEPVGDVHYRKFRKTRADGSTFTTYGWFVDGSRGRFTLREAARVLVGRVPVAA